MELKRKVEKLRQPKIKNKPCRTSQHGTYMKCYSCDWLIWCNKGRGGGGGGGGGGGLNNFFSSGKGEPIRERDLMVDLKIFLRLKAYCVS